MASITDTIRDATPRNQELLRVLSETDHAGPALEEQKRYLGDLSNQLDQSQKRIRSLEQQRAKELKDHEKYRDSVMRRFAYKVGGKTDKFVARAEKEEKEYFDVLQQEHQAKEHKESLERMRAEALSVQQELESQVARHTQAQQDLDQLYDSIFKGPTPSFPDEDSAEQRCRDALATYHNSSVKMEHLLHVARTLDEAKARLRDALSHIEDALDHSRMDMFGGGTISDMMERNALSKAESQVSQLMFLASQAQRMAPEVVRPLPPVKIAEGSLMSDVFFDNIFTDMAFHDKIKASREELRRCGRVLDGELAQAQARHQAAVRETSASSEALNNVRSELQSTRQRIFDRVGSGDAPPAYKE
ncbi:hypothetical protein F4778DRAFT_786115 [Xylariomycetidae sp. FL2044]|nr:hypothetical protein F4778DRAFT_786115 [Xylariomycetidae sp. FL2044]